LHRLGSVTVDRVKTGRDLRKSLEGRLPESEVLLIKPNWYSPHPSNYTDADALRMIMEAVDAKVIVVEGYSLDRQDGSMSLTVDGEKVDWGWLIRNPGWEWVKEKGRWNQIRSQDQWFRDEHGFTDLFAEHGAEYVNVTEEIWRGNTVESRKAKKRVEERYPAAFTEEIYGFMPRRLAAHMGFPMISLGRVKGYGGEYPSLSLKNMFGLIPDPLRVWWHGPDNARLDQSIIDITKLYASYFKLYGVNEAVKTLVTTDPEGEVEAPWGRYGVKPGHGLVAHGPNLLELDAVTCGLIDVDPGKVGYLQRGGEVFNTYSVDDVRRAEALRRHYLKP